MIGNNDNDDDDDETENETNKKGEEAEKHPPPSTILKSLENRAKSIIKSEKVGDPQSHSDYLTKNTMRLIEKTYMFLGGILLLFVIMSLVRESIVETVLPLFTLVIGGILGFMSKDLLRGPSTPNNTIS